MTATATPAENEAQNETIDDILKSELALITSGQVTRILDPLRLELDNKTIIQLSNMDIPDFSVHDMGPIASQALEYMKTLERKQIRLYQIKERPGIKNSKRVNRMGYQIGHIIRKDTGSWVQADLLSQGLSRLRPSKVHIALSTAMMEAEKTARDQNIGLWDGDYYRTHDTKTIHNAETGDWVIVEGVVQKAATVKNVAYLNFGDNWRTDFTIGVPSTVRRKLSGKGIDLQSLSGQKIRIHGWLDSYNGPYIELMAAEWISIADAASQQTPSTPPETLEKAKEKDRSATQNSVLKHSVISNTIKQLKPEPQHQNEAETDG